MLLLDVIWIVMEVYGSNIRWLVIYNREERDFVVKFGNYEFF